MKKIAFLAIAMSALLGLSACGKQLTTSKTTYKATGMVAVIKGEASSKTVKYQAPTGNGTSKVNSGSYVVTVPMSHQKQTVKLSADGQKKTVTVKAAKAIGDYKTISTKYNQAIVAMALPKDVQTQLAAAQKSGASAVAAMTPAQKVAYAKQQQALQAAMAKAQQATKSSQLPTSVDGLKQVLSTNGGKLRMNVQNGQLIAITDVVSVKALKNKKAKTDFGTQFGLIANATGADAKKVGKAFTKAIKDAGSGSTTIDTITSNGVKFNIGLSTSDLYIYITK
ncbi:hypothetical protein [Lacticaseibacillus porcinae]|uniref:hypothetical protein n=1 Tax=Lacticaseibacillus porcinae TaxID=1123687 RepID=UPI000F78B5D9|nr:hypothetical protein [Lacticaseibacillus porcinae]